MTPPAVLVVRPEERGMRLDRFLQGRLEGRSRSQLSRLLEAGHVSVEPAPRRALEPATRVVGGATVTVRFPPPEPTTLAPWAAPLDVLLELPELVVVDKPPGLVVHPGAGHRDHTLAHALLARYPEVAGAGSASRPGIVHRLDQATSGALVAARSHEAYLGLVKQFASRQVEKSYLAIVAGCPSPRSGTVDAPIGRDPVRRQQFSTRARSSRPARSHYRVLLSSGRFSLVEVRIETGRTHQIRVHMTAMGNPLVGDRTYGNAGRNLPGAARELALERGGAYLHAARIAFRRPATGEPVDVVAPTPADFKSLQEALGVA